jgi:hypothetical protein
MYICMLKCLYQAQKVSGHVYMYAKGIECTYVSTIGFLDIGTVPTFWYILIFHYI